LSSGNVEIVDMFMRERKLQRFVLHVNIQDPIMRFGKKITK